MENQNAKRKFFRSRPNVKRNKKSTKRYHEQLRLRAHRHDHHAEKGGGKSTVEMTEENPKEKISNFYLTHVSFSLEANLSRRAHIFIRVVIGHATTATTTTTTTTCQQREIIKETTKEIAQMQPKIQQKNSRSQIKGGDSHNNCLVALQRRLPRSA